MESKQYIQIQRINKEMFKRQFRYKRKPFKIVGAVGLMSLSFIVPDLGAGLIFGLMLLSPISLKDSIKLKYSDINFYINKKLVLWGLI